MADVIVDASAVLAQMLGERGADRVDAVLGDSMISAVNFAEVISRLIDGGAPLETIQMAAEELRAVVIPFDESAAMRAGLLRRATRSKGLSLGDRACLALAEATGLPVMTADRAWAELDLGVEVVLIR